MKMADLSRFPDSGRYIVTAKEGYFTSALEHSGEIKDSCIACGNSSVLKREAVRSEVNISHSKYCKSYPLRSRKNITGNTANKNSAVVTKKEAAARIAAERSAGIGLIIGRVQPPVLVRSFGVVLDGMIRQPFRVYQFLPQPFRQLVGQPGVLLF